MPADSGEVHQRLRAEAENGEIYVWRPDEFDENVSPLILALLDELAATRQERDEQADFATKEMALAAVRELDTAAEWSKYAEEVRNLRAEMEWLKAVNTTLVARHARLAQALAEIESFPVSGYHAGEAQRIARDVLAEEPVGEA